MQTIAFDISVFLNDTEAIMYITKDIYSDRFIISIPVITLSFDVRMNNPKNDYEWFLHSNGVAMNRDEKKRLIEAIKEAITEFE